MARRRNRWYDINCFSSQSQQSHSIVVEWALNLMLSVDDWWLLSLWDEALWIVIHISRYIRKLVRCVAVVSLWSGWVLAGCWMRSPIEWKLNYQMYVCMCVCVWVALIMFSCVMVLVCCCEQLKSHLHSLWQIFACLWFGPPVHPK